MKEYVYKGLEFPKDHYFSDKCVLFMGTLDRCPPRDAKDRLFFDYGGVPVSEYVEGVRLFVAAKGAETTDNYKKAQDLWKRGFGTILTEQEFFDVLDGNFTPPENPNYKESTAIVSLPLGMSKEQSKAHDAAEYADFIARKRDEYLRKRKPANNKYDVRLQSDINLRFDYKQTNIMWTALGRWGEPAQVGMAVEECAELIVALQKYINRTHSPDTLESIVDEIADVEIMLAQMRLTFGISDEILNKKIKQKFAKLEKYLKKGN